MTEPTTCQICHRANHAGNEGGRIEMIPDIDSVILQAILAIPVALVLFVALVLLVLREWERRNL